MQESSAQQFHHISRSTIEIVTGEFHKALYVLDVGSNQSLKKGKQWTLKQIEKN